MLLLYWTTREWSKHVFGYNYNNGIYFFVITDNKVGPKFNPTNTPWIHAHGNNNQPFFLFIAFKM